MKNGIEWATVKHTKITNLCCAERKFHRLQEYHRIAKVYENTVINNPAIVKLAVSDSVSNYYVINGHSLMPKR